MRALAVLVVAAAACSGSIAGGGDDGVTSPAGGSSASPGAATPAPGGAPMPGAPDPGPNAPVTAPGTTTTTLPVRPLLRLTRFEYDNTVRDLLGDTTRPGSALPEDNEGPHGYDVAAAVSPLDATVLQEIAERLASGAVKNLAKLVPCKSATPDDACARQFIASFGQRAFRRPLLPDETTAIQGLYDTARTQLGYDSTQGLRVVIAALLQSPEFLYHWELGAQAPTLAGKLVQLTSWELASRLSYLLTGSMPDDELFAAAQSGALGTAAGVAAQARRLLAAPRARDGMGDLFRQWWDLDRIRRTDKGANVMGWDGLRDPMYAETKRFVEAVVFEGDATVKSLLTAPYTFTNNANLAKVYGATLPATTVNPAPMQKIDLDPGQRAGFLTQGSFLAAQAAPTDTSPVKRGKLVLTQILCTKIPDPPAEVPALPPASSTLKTMRQRSVEHMQNPLCAACHRLLDPLGFAFEIYDTVGKFRTMDRTDPIDASGTFTIGGRERAFKNALELTQILGAAPETHACAARQMLRYALGRLETMDDAPSLDEVARTGNLRDLVLALVQSKAFMFRAPAPGEVLR
jgi:hypothetical protein